MYKIEAIGCTDLFAKFLELVKNKATPDQTRPSLMSLNPFIAKVLDPRDFIVSELCASFNPLLWLESVMKGAIAFEKFEGIDFIEDEDVLHAEFISYEPFRLLEVQELCLALCIEASKRNKKVGTLLIRFNHVSIFSQEMCENMTSVMIYLVKNIRRGRVNNHYHDFSINKEDRMKLLGNSFIETSSSPFLRYVYLPVKKAYYACQNHCYREALDIIERECLHEHLAYTMKKWISSQSEAPAAVS